MSTQVAKQAGKPAQKREWRWWRQEPEKLQRLEFAFMCGMTDEQAIVYADISMAQLYYYQRLTPDFRIRKDLLKNQTSYQARQNIINAINRGDTEKSAWWLERKEKAEFSPRHESMNLNVNAEVELDEQKKEELRRIIGNNE